MRFLRRLLGIETLIGKADCTMAKIKEVLDEIGTLRAFIAAEAAEVAGIIQGLTDQVTALRAQIEAGGAASAADLDSVLAQLKEAETGVQSIVTPPTTPSEETPPT